VPYRNEHSCKLVDPDQVDVVGSDEREHEGKKYRVIFGKPKDDGGSVEQAYRYPLEEGWTEDGARNHCEAHDGILFEPAEPEGAGLSREGRERRFIAAVHSIETGDEEHLATFYLMNTTVNRNGWGVTDKALEEAMPTILWKPLGCGPGYRIDAHYPEPMKLGRFVAAEKPDGYGLGTAEITDDTAWTRLTEGEWGPVSVVILSYKDTCSSCGEDLTHEEDPFSHECIARGEGYLLVESFVFQRVDFIDTPAVPQAGFINVAQAQTQVPLELCARLYESQSNQDPAQGPGAQMGSNPEGEERKKMDNELQQRVTELEQQLIDEKKAREDAETRVTELEARQHAEIVESVLEARAEAGLLGDIEEERERFTGYPEDALKQMKADAVKAAKTQIKTEPKAKYAGPSDELKTAIEDTRMRLFGRREA